MGRDVNIITANKASNKIKHKIKGKMPSVIFLERQYSITPNVINA